MCRQSVMNDSIVWMYWIYIDRERQRADTNIWYSCKLVPTGLDNAVPRRCLFYPTLLLLHAGLGAI